MAEIKGIVAVACALLAGCATVAQVTTLSNTACHDAFASGMTAILLEQQESPPVASQIAYGAAQSIKAGGVGTRPLAPCRCSE